MKLNGNSKLNDNFINALKSVLSDTDSVIIFTDEELLAETNELLNKEERVCNRTFRRWKAEAIKIDDTITDLDTGTLIDKFTFLVKKALRKAKKQLYENLKSEDSKFWTRWAWIFERKFDSWNLRKILDVKLDPTGLPEIVIFKDTDVQQIIEANKRCIESSDNRIIEGEFTDEV